MTITPEKSRPNAALLNPFKMFLERVLAILAAGLLFCMMLVTFIDVIGRYLFDAPVPGGFEVTELMLAALIFLGLPLVTASDGHVTVDLFDSLIPQRLRPLQAWLVSLLTIFAFAVMTWKMWQFAWRTYSYADTTAVLQIPYSPLVFMMASMATLTTLAQAAMLFLNNGKPFLTYSSSSE